MDKRRSKNHTAAFIIYAFACMALCGCSNVSPSASKEIADTEAFETATPTPVKEPVIVMEDTTDDTAEEPVGETEDDVPAQESYDESQYFQIEEISDELFSKMQGNSFPEECTTPREDLRYLNLLYKDKDGNPHAGEMVCNVSIADKLTDIFRKLYEADYPIEKIRLIDEYGGDDDASMADNNTSCFNYRVVSGTTKISKHGYGLAVDLNPFYNPYIHTVDGQTVIEPPGSEPYADREADYDYKIDEDDLAYKLFTEAGFTWGGSWKTMKDYQHFQMD